MTQKGTIIQYSAAIMSSRYMSVKFDIDLNAGGEHITAQLKGTVTEVCTLLNCIPCKGRITGNHLLQASCALRKINGIYYFEQLN